MRIINLCLAAACCLLLLGAVAQESPISMSKISQYDLAGDTYGDVWGDGNYLYGAHYGASKIDILDISIPSAPMLASVYSCSASNAGSSAQEVAVANGAMFVGLEANGTDDVEIVDVRNPYAPVLKTRVNVSALSHVHNLIYDNGWLYLVDSRTQQVAIVDLRTYNLNSAPATITTAKWVVNLAGTTYGGQGFVHDIHVNNGRLYCCDWDAGLFVYDVSNVANQAPVFLTKVQASSCHSAHASADNKYVLACDERNGGALRVYEFKDTGPGTSELVLKDQVQFDVARAICIHDGFFVGDRIYCSWYQTGVQVFDFDRDTERLYLAARYDTTAQTNSNNGYGGCWGVYPYLGRSKILASDLDNGFFVLSDNAFYVDFSYPNGIPQYTVPGSAAVLRVKIAGDAAPTAGTVTLHAKVNGGSQQNIAMTSVSADEWEGSLPAAPCDGNIEWWVDASFPSVGTKSDPPAGYGHFWAHPSTGLIPVFGDNFEANLGWVVSNAGGSTGGWERSNPVGTPAQPEDDHSSPGTICYVTANGSIGGGIADQDIDGGPHTLTSPALDFSTGNGEVSFYYWFYNDDGDDFLLVQVSNNNGGSWTTVANLNGSGGGWRPYKFTVGDYVVPTATVKVRFTAADSPNNSVTEAAIDDFSADRFDCTIPASLTGVIDLQNLIPSPAGLQPAIQFRIVGTQTVVASYPVTLDGSGGYTVASVMAGTWDLSVKYSNWLRDTVPNVVVAGPTSAGFSLRNGDAVQDNTVDIFDFNQMLTDFGGSGTGDIDKSGLTDIFDINIGVTNFGQSGDL